LDRKSGVFRDCTDSIYRGFHYSDIPNDSTIILASKYTFNFNTGKLLDGIYFGKYRHQGDFFHISQKNMKLYLEKMIHFGCSGMGNPIIYFYQIPQLRTPK